MNHLLYRDFLLMKRNWRSIVLTIALLFIALSNSGGDEFRFYTMAITFTAYFLVTLILSFDYKNNSETLMLSLPVTRKQLVISRYVSLLIISVLSIVLVLFIGLIAIQVGYLTFNLSETIDGILLGLTSFFVISFLVLPIYFKWGYRKASILNVSVFLIIFIAQSAFASLLQLFPNASSQLYSFITKEEMIAKLIGVLVMVMIGFLSLNISQRLFRKRGL